MVLRATSHTRPRACDHYTSSTLIGGKGGVGPSSLHTMLEGPTEYVNARWMESLHGFLHGTKWTMLHGRLDYFQKPFLQGRSIIKLGDHGAPNAHNRWCILFYHVWIPVRIDIIKIAFGWGPNHIWLHTTWLWSYVGTAFGHYVLGSHNFMVMALGSHVKWP